MWTHRRVIGGIAAALVTAAGPGRAAAQQARALVRGVPYVSWRDASAASPRERGALNPSAFAAMDMVAMYWSDTLRTPAQATAALPRGGWFSESSGVRRNVESMDSLKAYLSRGIPVVVSLSLSPRAHPLNPALAIAMAVGAMRNVALPEGPRSGTLGRMVDLDSVPALRTALREGMKQDWNPLRESVLVAYRVAIGFDDARQVVLVHDPSFGPALEIGYTDFERMWSALDHVGIALVPPDAERIIARRAAAPDYRTRTPDERAALEYVSGYALSATGHVTDGIERFRAGLAIPGVGAGYRHLLLLDLAVSLLARGEADAAAAAASEAATLVPDHVRAWGVLADAYARCSRPDHDALAREAARRADRLAGDKGASERSYAALPHDVLLWMP